MRGIFELNLASAVLKQIIELQDVDTWSVLRAHYLPTEFHTLYKVIQKHADKYQTLPTFEELRLGIRDQETREKLYAVEAVEVDVDADILFQYLKNEYVVGEVIDHLDKYVTDSISFEDAEETIENLHSMAMDLEVKAELEHPTESMQTIDLFDNDEELGRYLSLGLNREFDSEVKFSPRDFICIGGRRGEGKSVVCANVASNVVVDGRSALYFTIEMDARATLQRICSITTQVPLSKLRMKNLDDNEWEKVVHWWANRFKGGEDILEEYYKTRSFDKFHRTLTSSRKLREDKRIDIVYDPDLTVSKIRSEIDKRAKSSGDLGIILVDYINQVKRSMAPSPRGQYDWTEQIEISKSLKNMAQIYDVPILSPYQIDASGEARFAKGILDAADAAYIINAHDHEDACMEFKCVKMRNGSQQSFSSVVDWASLKIGPENGYVSDGEDDDDGLSTDEPPFEVI
jgi:replicative DNA helicase